MQVLIDLLKRNLFWVLGAVAATLEEKEHMNKVAYAVCHAFPSIKIFDGEALPSMRNLALQMRISVITTKRAYEELEREGFIESYTGKGSFVKAQNKEFLREENLRKIEEGLREVVEMARVSGVGPDELKSILEIIYQE